MRPKVLKLLGPDGKVLRVVGKGSGAEMVRWADRDDLSPRA